MPPFPYEIRAVESSHPANWTMLTYAWSDSPIPRPMTTSEEPPSTARVLMAFDGEEGVGRIATNHMSMNVRGRVMPFGGVGGAVTMPIARRQGTMRQLVTASLEAMHAQDGYAIAALYPFRESFYERLGFALWPHPAWAQVSPANLAPALKMEKAGRLSHHRLAEGMDRWLPFIRMMQGRVHGFALADHARLLAMRKDDHFWLTLVEEAGEVTGAMLYRNARQERRMIVWSFAATTPDAHYGLLEWIARHTDQLDTVLIRLLPGARPELWVSDSRLVSANDVPCAWLAPMGRVVNVAGLAGIGAGDGRVCLEVTDAQCPWNTGCWTLEGRDGALAVHPGGQPEGAVTIQGLSSAVFTGLDPQCYRFKGWGDLPGAAAEALQAIFPPATPFLHEEF